MNALRLVPKRVHVRFLADHAANVKLKPAETIASANLELVADGEAKHASCLEGHATHLWRHYFDHDGVTDSRSALPSGRASHGFAHHFG